MPINGSGQLEHPHRRSTVDVLDFRHERREPRRLRAALTHADRDILLSVHRVRNRSVARHIGQARLPEQFAGLVVVRSEVPIDRDAARGRS